MNLKMFRPLILAPLMAGCIVVHEEPVRRAPPPPPPPAAEPAPVQQMAPEDAEVNDVVYREYFGGTDAEIYAVPHYQRYYGCTPGDIYFLFFMSRLCHITFDACFRSYYYDCGRSYDRMVTYYRVPRERFFVSIGAGVNCPPAYAHSYGCYRDGSYTRVSFSNAEYVSLVHMKVGCEYQGHPPATYFARVQTCGSPSRVIVESRDNCGRGTTVTGTRCTVTAQRPWTMPPQQKQVWHQEHEQKVVRCEASFTTVHKEQVTKVQTREREEAARQPASNANGPKAHGNPNAPGQEKEKSPNASVNGATHRADPAPNVPEPRVTGNGRTANPVQPQAERSPGNPDAPKVQRLPAPNPAPAAQEPPKPQQKAPAAAAAAPQEQPRVQRQPSAPQEAPKVQKQPPPHEEKSKGKDDEKKDKKDK